MPLRANHRRLTEGYGILFEMVATSVQTEHVAEGAVPAVETKKARPALLADALAMGVILAFALAFLSPIFSGKVPIAADTLGLWSPWSQVATTPVRNDTLADTALLYLSWETFAKSAISDGEWPMWDPYSFSGFPFAANSQNQVYYPLTWLLWLLPLSGALQTMAVFNICLAGWGMYFFCRVLGIGTAGALVGALAFCGSGILQTAIELPGVASVYGWLPWMLLTSELALRNRSWKWTAAAALCCGLQLVAGHLQWVIYSYFALGCWMAMRIVISAFSRPDSPNYNRLRLLGGSVVRGAIILAGGLLLAAVHLAPFVELTSLASRGGVRVSSHSEPLLDMLRSVVPNFFGTPLVVPNYPLMFNNLWYIGIAPLILAAWGLLFSRQRAVAIFWAAMALFAVLVTFGIGPFLFVRWLPGLQATLPNRIGYLFVAGLSVLAALGLDAWLSMSASRRSVLALCGLSLATVVAVSVPLFGWLTHQDWVVGGFPAENGPAMNGVQAADLARVSIFSAATLAILGLLLISRGRRKTAQRVASYAVVPLLCLDLLLAIAGYNTYVEPKDLKPGTAGIRWLRQQPTPWRMMPLRNAKIQPSFVPNSQLIFGLPSVDGYDSLHDSRYDDYWAAADPQAQSQPGAGPYANVFVLPQAYTSTLASLLGVKYIVSREAIDAPGFEQPYKGEVHIYENPEALPKVFLVDQSQNLAPKDVLARLASKDFDPRKTVLLEGSPSSTAGSGSSASQSPGDARLTSYKRDTITVEASASQPSWLVLTDVNYPGWHVSLDGHEQPVLTADYILRAVKLEPGKHTVEFWFLPSYFVPTLIVSGLSLLTVVVVLLWPRSRAKRVQPPLRQTDFHS